VLKKEGSWYLYVVRCSDDTLYTGITTDINRRVYEHNNAKKGAKYTRSRRPVELECWAIFANRSCASKAEYKFKKKTRKDKKAFIENVELFNTL
jgi:putative endonuclease